MEENEKFHIYISVIWWSILFIAAMYLMIDTANHKMIVIADGTYGQETIGESGEAVQGQRLRMEPAGGEAGVFLISLEEETKAENVVVENRYMDRALHIFIKGAHEEFYGKHAIQGDVTAIRNAYEERQRSGVLLKLHMDGVYEYRTSMDGNTLRVEVCEPHELYRLLVVVDPAGGGPIGVNPDMEAYRAQIASALVLEVSRLLPERLDNENIRIYFTRTEDEEVSAERRRALVEDVGADLFLRVDLSVDEDTAKYGVCGRYNESYFIPEFGNVEFADIVTRNVTIACGNRAVGLEAAGEDSILQKIRIPAAEIALGYMTNEEEGALLSQNDYKEKLAKGIAEALMEVYSTHYE